MVESIRIERGPPGISIEAMANSVYWAGMLGTYSTAMDLMENTDLLEEAVSSCDPAINYIHFPGTRQTRWGGGIGFSVHPVLKKDARGAWQLDWTPTYNVRRSAACLTH